MAKTRFVNTRFWRDEYILSLKPDARLLFLWAITNPETELCGAYKAAESSIRFETGLNRKRIGELFSKFEKDGKILYRDGWVVVMNFTRHQNGTSTNIKKAADRTLSYCPDWVKDTLSNGITPVSVGVVPRPIPKPIPKPIPSESAADAAPPEPGTPPPSDPRKSHPAIVTVQEVARRYPPKEIWDDIIDAVGLDVDLARMRKCFSTWIGRGFNRTNYDWLMDWYVNNSIPTAGRNGHAKHSGNSPKRDTSTDRLRATSEIYDKYEPSET